MEMIRAFASLSREDLPLAGGKGANLGAMTRADLPVPPGFVLLTGAYRLFVAEAGIQPEIERLVREADPESQPSLDEASARIRALFAAGSMPPAVADAITDAYGSLGGGPVAVRSSATAEDLPDASFAGQQESYLNIAGDGPLLDAVRRCWSSLWTGRALAYRARAGIAPADVALAVVVQRLVAADAAGVLFTADPVSGRRDRMVIDGAWGLGEAVVSGAVSPDHWLADAASGAVIAAQVAAKSVMTVRTPEGTELRAVPAELQSRPVLEPAQVAALVELGRRAAAYFGAPQDLEWALAGGELFLVQSRPITTLFPVPQPAPPPEAGLRIYATVAGMQGVLEPLTPAGISAFQSLVISAPRFLGLKSGPGVPRFFTQAAGRIYFDVTPILRTQGGRSVLAGGTIDAAMGRAVLELLERNEGRLGPGALLRLSQLSKLLLLTQAGRAFGALISPARARRRAQRQIEAMVQSLADESRRLGSMAERLRFIDMAISSALSGIAPRSMIRAIPGHAALRIAERKLKAWGLDPAVLEPVGRSIPHNPTTEMDLALWRLSRRLRAEGAEPRADHPGVQALLAEYGHRAVREIDLGVPRWSEEPGHVLHLLAAYMEQAESADDPAHHFERGAVAADEAIAAVSAAVRRRKGPVRAAIIRLLLNRFRQLAGLREWHKFYLVKVWATIRRVLLEAGAELVQAGRLDQAGDVFFLAFADLESDRDLRAAVASNRADYERELKRRAVPLAITSEGEVAYGRPPQQDGALVGLGASAGVCEGVVRVILDPAGARLEPGEILVAPGTDPAWTPLFLTAGGLVTETGGMISHGSVVAREYGIPAVVGVQEATTRLRTGQRVRVDGSAGTVMLLEC